MDAIEKESVILYKICCSIGLSSSQLKRNKKLVDCVTTNPNMNFIKGSNATSTICGSRSEGLTPFSDALPNTLTDVDSMYIFGGINVQEHVDTTNKNEAEVLQLLYTDSPGYVLLEVRSSKGGNKTFNNTPLWWMPQVIVGKHSTIFVSSSLSKVFTQKRFTERASSCSSVSVSNVNDLRITFGQGAQSFKKTTIHGPAVEAEPIPLSSFWGTDSVCCFRCYEWPTAAHEWIHRARPHGWPTQDLIDQLMNDGCELVPVGRKGHPDEHVQWKLSFSRAETRLIRKFNIYQAQCYQLLKIVKHHFISPVVPDSLSSYHIKTVMLHTVEQTDPKVWRKENLVQCFMMCLSNLKRDLTKKFLSQYFIVRQNLLEPKLTGDVHQKVLEIVTDLDKIGWKCILQCPVFDLLYQSIQEPAEGIIPYTMRTDLHALMGNKELILDLCSALLFKVSSQVESLSYNCYLIQSVVSCEKTFVKPTTIHPSVETARVLQLLLKSELGILLTVLRAMSHPDLQPRIDPLMNFARQCLEVSCHADVSSCRLKFATFYFHLGEYDRCIETVQNVLERFNDVCIVGGRLDENVDEIEEIIENMDTSKLGFKLNQVLRLSDNGFPFLSNHLSLPAFFSRWEIAVAPKGVQYLNKKMPRRNELINVTCCIDSIVYAHYLLLESYLNIQEYDLAEHALINMKESIQNGNDDLFDSKCLCFCKEDKLLLQYSVRKMKVAKNVKDK